MISTNVISKDELKVVAIKKVHLLHWVNKVRNFSLVCHRKVSVHGMSLEVQIKKCFLVFKYIKSTHVIWKKNSLSELTVGAAGCVSCPVHGLHIFPDCWAALPPKPELNPLLALKVDIVPRSDQSCAKVLRRMCE